MFRRRLKESALSRDLDKAGIKSLGVQIYFTGLAACGILIHLIFRFLIPELDVYANIPLYVVLVFGGVPIILDLFVKMISLNFGSDLLAGASIITAVILKDYLVATIVILMLSGGQTIEAFAVRTASKVLEALAKRAPTIAHRRGRGREEEITIEDILIDDTLIIYPNEICPVDGEVIEGNGVMDEAYLTGEPFLISKAPGSQVISGAINGDDALVIKAKKLAIDSRYAKIMQVMSDSAQMRPRMRRLADQLGGWFTPISIAIALLAWISSGEVIRFLAVLVIATPCPLLIGIPVAIIGSISLCASRGILIKDPIVLEQLDQCETILFDKTGTLTYGKPELEKQIVYASHRPEAVLTFAASLEKYSKHPLSSAVLSRAIEEKLVLIDAEQIRETKGMGLQGKVQGHEVVITSRKHLEQFGLSGNALPQGKGLECIILIDGVLAAYYRFRDTLREDSSSFIQHLSEKHGFKKIMILSGDRMEEVKYLSSCVGITEIYADQSPEDKVAIVMRETQKCKTVYVGDGINDAPALLAATVGICFGPNSDITAEASGVVVLDSSFEKVDEFFHISRRMRKIGLQSGLGGMILSVFGMGMAAFGWLIPLAGAIAQEVIDVIVVINSLRTIWRPKVLTDMWAKKRNPQ